MFRLLFNDSHHSNILYFNGCFLTTIENKFFLLTYNFDYMVFVGARVLHIENRAETTSVHFFPNDITIIDDMGKQVVPILELECYLFA